MVAIEDRLVEIKEKDLSILKKMYTAKNGSRISVAYITIVNYIRWIETDPSESKDIKFYCLNGDFSDGTFIVIERIRAYADTLSNSFENLQRLLQLLDYSMGYFFLSVRSELRQVFRYALKNANIKIAHEYCNLHYHLRKEEALKFNPKRDDVILRPITDLHDFEKINSLWSLRCERSLSYIQRLAKYNLNCGAYTKDGTLVSWIFCSPDGQGAILQTDKMHCGNGYGTLVVKALLKKMAEMGHDVYGAINEENTPVQILLSRVGLKVIDYVYCIATENAWTAGAKYVKT